MQRFFIKDDGFVKSNFNMSLRGVKRRSNLLKLCTYDLKDCFATPAMTDNSDFLSRRDPFGTISSKMNSKTLNKLNFISWIL